MSKDTRYRSMYEAILYKRNSSSWWLSLQSLHFYRNALRDNSEDDSDSDSSDDSIVREDPQLLSSLVKIEVGGYLSCVGVWLKDQYWALHVCIYIVLNV